MYLKYLTQMFHHQPPNSQQRLRFLMRFLSLRATTWGLLPAPAWPGLSVSLFLGLPSFSAAGLTQDEEIFSSTMILSPEMNKK